MMARDSFQELLEEKISTDDLVAHWSRLGAMPPDASKYIFAVAALRMIAMSYRERIDRGDTPPYQFADLALRYLGDSGSWTEAENDKANEMMRGFRVWRLAEGE